jgi:imidazolonepropionase
MRRAHKILSPREEAALPPRVVTKKRGLLLINAGEIVTMAGLDKPRRGEQMKDLGIVSEGAIYSSEGKIVEVGDSKTLKRKYSDASTVIDAEGKLVAPGFVDPHTHLIFAGSRENELELKLRGATYQEIAASGGGLLGTVAKTRAATTEELISEASSRLRGMLEEGTTTAEAKSGYALDSNGELKILGAIESLSEQQPVDLVPTFLGAHAVPPEFEGRTDAYIDLLVNELLLLVARKTAARFCDVWVEQGYFSVEQARRLLIQAKSLGLTPKVHADELSACGGAELAGEMEAASADHLIHVSDGGLEAMKSAGTVAVLLPAASMSSRLPYADARRIISAGVPVAIGTDLNPGCWVESMQFIVSLAVHKLAMQPAEALTAATINAAHAINAAREVGSLEPGKSADFLIFNVPNHRQMGYRFGRSLVEVVAKKGNVVVDRRIR